jgi:acyl carrier protein
MRNMSNESKYNNIFMEVFEIDADQLTDTLEYQSIPTWDSIGHMTLMAALEDEFEIMLEMDDIVDFGSYKKGFETLKAYGIEF